MLVKSNVPDVASERKKKQQQQQHILCKDIYYRILPKITVFYLVFYPAFILLTNLEHWLVMASLTVILMQKWGRPT